MDTINKLLKKQAPKTNKRSAAAAAAAAALAGDATPNSTAVAEPEKPLPNMIRWVHNRDGSRIGVPEEWLDGPAGRMFGGPKVGLARGKMVEEVV
jgi:Ino eighty subunit 2